MRSLFFLLVAGLLSLSAQADVTFSNVETFLGVYGNGARTTIEFRIDISAPEGVYYATYNSGGASILRVGTILTPVGWTGPGVGPTIKIARSANAATRDNCPGMPSSSWSCESLGVDITVHGESHGCPWVVTTIIRSTDGLNGGTYTGPRANQTKCPTEPVAPYDVSWDENYVAHNKTVRLSGGSGVVTQTLSTYLMKDGKLCDGSQINDRGAYCRLVAQLMTFTASGCDDARVSVTPTPHPITDKQLHDMVLQVNTSNNVPAIAATCRFQYILNEL
ncbi:StfH/YfcO family fimbrial adhesin [Escherichia albertii]|uniref:StfH/YfcO family fimbrial adhesin n=1 Tax=Escherichia albertii TaxID=208962 RepID=UPI0032D8E691